MCAIKFINQQSTWHGFNFLHWSWHCHHKKNTRECFDEIVQGFTFESRCSQWNLASSVSEVAHIAIANSMAPKCIELGNSVFLLFCCFVVQLTLDYIAPPVMFHQANKFANVDLQEC